MDTQYSFTAENAYIGSDEIEVSMDLIQSVKASHEKGLDEFVLVSVEYLGLLGAHS